MDDASHEKSALTAAVPTTQPRDANRGGGAESRRSRQRTGVLVLGMHRSGTSGIARVFSLLGCDLPKTLMGAGPGNEAGHWESDAVTAFNEKLLESAGSSWHDWLPVNSGWFCSPKAEEFRTAALDLLAQEFGASRLFVLKDPRICKLLPFWLDVIDAAGIHPVLVLPVRNPLEVAASLKARDELDLGLGALIWLRHVLDAEAGTRGRSRFFCTYDELMMHWPRLIQRAQEALGVSFPRAPSQAEQEISAFLNRQLRHHHETPESVLTNPHLSVWIRDAFDVFERWSANGEDSGDYGALDSIRDDLTKAGPAFASALTSGQTAAKNARRLEEEASRLGAERDAAVERVAHVTAERDRERALYEVQKRIVQSEHEQARAAYEEQCAEASRLVDTLSARVIELERERDRLQSALEDADRFRGELDRLRTELEVRDAEAAELRESGARLSAQLSERSVEIAMLARLLQEKEVANGSAAQRLAESEAKVQERFGEIALITKLLREQETALSATLGEAEWVRRVAATLLVGGERWRGRLFLLLPGFVIRMWVLRHLKRNGLFDADAYLRANPDVARRGVNALRHYIHHGMRERRGRS